MGLKFRCKTCGEDVVVRFLKVGEAAECKNCGASNPVPESAESADDKTAASYQSRARGTVLLSPTPNVDVPPKPAVNHTVYATLWILMGWGVALPVLLLSSYPVRRRIGRVYGTSVAIVLVVLILNPFSGATGLGLFDREYWRSLSVGLVALGIIGSVVASKLWERRKLCQ